MHDTIKVVYKSISFYSSDNLKVADSLSTIGEGIHKVVSGTDRPNHNGSALVMKTAKYVNSNQFDDNLCKITV